jgi:hypothetical protein
MLKKLFDGENSAKFKTFSTGSQGSAYRPHPVYPRFCIGIPTRAGTTRRRLAYILTGCRTTSAIVTLIIGDGSTFSLGAKISLTRGCMSLPLYPKNLFETHLAQAAD